MAKYGRRWEVFKMYGIEQKLKIIGYAERHGKAACYDAFDVKARTLRRWRRLYREEWRWPYQTVGKAVAVVPKADKCRLRSYRLSARHKTLAT